MKQKKQAFSLSKRILLSALLAAVMAFSFVGETSAYLIHSSSVDTTTLQGSNIDIVVKGTTTSPVTAYITNNGNVPAYVRVVLAVNWVNQDTNNWYAEGSYSTTRQVLAQAPRKGAQTTTHTNDDGSTSTSDYNYTVRSADWLETTITESVGTGTVGYTVLYYRKPLAAGASTSTMFSSFSAFVASKQATSQSTPRTFKLTVDFLADAIQCETAGRFAGTTAQTAVAQEWGVTLSAVGGNITAGPTTDAIPCLQ